MLSSVNWIKCKWVINCQKFACRIPRNIPLRHTFHKRNFDQSCNSEHWQRKAIAHSVNIHHSILWRLSETLKALDAFVSTTPLTATSADWSSSSSIFVVMLMYGVPRIRIGVSQKPPFNRVPESSTLPEMGEAQDANSYWSVVTRGVLCVQRCIDSWTAWFRCCMMAWNLYRKSEKNHNKSSGGKLEAAPMNLGNWLICSMFRARKHRWLLR